ncbi:MAG TPA: hypothetical protein VH482_04530 [Thermomicrobiales bacterium]
METMSGWQLILAWVVCVIVGAAVGFLAGYILWKIGLELIGSAVALVGAGVGGIIAFLWFLQWSDDRRGNG